MLAGDMLMAVVDEEPIGERIGSLIFWPVLALLVAVIVWAMIKKSRQGSGAGGRGSAKRGGGPGRGGGSAKTWTKPEDYREHHRVVWDEDPETFAPADLHWPLAVAAVFGICGGDPWDRLAFANLEEPRSGLQEAWGIRSRGQLLGRVHWLLREGHRVGFAEEIGEWGSLDDSEAARLQTQLRKNAGGEAEEQAWRLQQVRANARGIRETRFEAWDLVRAAMLCRAGHSLGWLGEAETVDTLNLLSAQLQREYSGWQELGEHFNRARWYWGGNSDLQSKQEDAHDLSRQEALLDAQRGPWAHVPWSQRIPDSRLLLVDALVDEELVVEAPFSSETPLATIIDRAVAERLGDRA